MNPDSKSVMIDKKISENNEDERVKRERDEKEVEQDKEQEGEVCDEAATETSLTGVDFKKMLSEIQNFKDHFTIKGFLLGLVLGLIPSGWDTFSDFAFAADDHNRTIELINATNKFEYVTDLGNDTHYTFAQFAYNKYVEASLLLSNDSSTKENGFWILDERTIPVVTYFCISIPSLVTVESWILNFDIKCCGSCANNCLKLFGIVVAWVGGVLVFLDDCYGSKSNIVLSLALISAAAVLTIKVLAVFVHGPEMKKFSQMATMAESNYESAVQLMFVILISLWADEVSKTGLMSMLSSLVMIGKSSADNYLTFGSKNLLTEASHGQRLFLLATTTPVFVLTAIFRIGSFSLICAWDHMLATCGLHIAHCTFILSLLFLKASNHLKDLNMGNLVKSYVSEAVTISLWGRRGREESRHLQMGTSFYFLLLYSSFLIQIILYPNGRIWFDPSPTYHPDPATLQTCSIITLCSGWIALCLQILLQKLPILYQLK